ncbi:MAG: integrase arm-type DNA-binding domain-containing protein [Myxococcales bacterium]|nr:integrase arm-type DNA-binding domain-containing protein [Myxococcales bacterium]
MSLTNTAIRAAKPSEKAKRMFDGRGLYLEVSPSGGKLWRFKYRFGGVEKRLALGVYPEVSLRLARDQHVEARQLLANGIDPGENRRAQKANRVARASNSFEVIAREWFDSHTNNWSASHRIRVIRRLEQNVFPWIGGTPIADVTAQQLLDAIRRIEKRGALETAHRILNSCSQVFRYAVGTGRAKRDPSVDLRGALPPVKGKHFASVTDPKRFGEVLRMLDGCKGTLVVCCALRFAPLVFVRPGELRQAEWADVDLDAAEWRYTVTKTDTQHIVPLSRQAVQILRELYPLTGSGRYVFRGARSAARPMSENTVNAAMRLLDIDKRELSGHGFRAAARTILDEVLGFRVDFIEHQLAHAVRDPNGRAYNRTAHLPERQKMMQDWADYLDRLKADADDGPSSHSS